MIVLMCSVKLSLFLAVSYVMQRGTNLEPTALKQYIRQSGSQV